MPHTHAELATKHLTPQEIHAEINTTYIKSFKTDEYKIVPLSLQHFNILVSYYIYTAQNKTSLSACKKITPNNVWSAYVDCCMNL